jgi:hypothetical protein
MTRLAVALLALLGYCSASAERIKRAPPTPAEQERIDVEAAMNDSLLRKGDIVSTGRGFLLYRGLVQDGASCDFAAIPHPFSSSKEGEQIKGR